MTHKSNVSNVSYRPSWSCLPSFGLAGIGLRGEKLALLIDCRYPKDNKKTVTSSDSDSETFISGK